jgi:predicted O-methyltransferase YrrM
MKKWNEIPGWFDYQQTYKFLISTIPDGGIFVECGAWLGASSAYLCDISKDTITIYIVDTWKGSPDELDSHHKLATETDIFSIFVENMGSRKFTPLRMDSCEAAKQFDDESLDVVYIDMTHTYEAVKKDIQCWLPKVKTGGYIAGHDYGNFPGVFKAVNEAFSNKITVMDSISWIVKKENL